jgi:hypothetical protein
MGSMLNNEEYDYTFYTDTEPDTQKFMLEAISDFCDKCIGYPDAVYINCWRRITTLTPDKWLSIKSGVVPVLVKSPQDNDIPVFLDNIPLPAHVALCIRKKATPPTNVVPPVPIVGES